MKIISVHFTRMDGCISEIAEIASLRSEGIALFNKEPGGLKMRKTKQPEYFKLQKSLMAKAA